MKSKIGVSSKRVSIFVYVCARDFLTLPARVRALALKFRGLYCPGVIIPSYNCQYELHRSPGFAESSPAACVGKTR